MRSKTIVLKFGGTSVGSIERIKIVSKIILSHKSKNTKVAVISSAILENFSISFLFIVFMYFKLLT